MISPSEEVAWGDAKVGNVLVDQEDHLKLIDFGGCSLPPHRMNFPTWATSAIGDLEGAK